MTTTIDPILEELAEELEGTLHVIAHAGHASDLDYIRRSQEYFRKKYGHVVSDDLFILEGDHVDFAYAKFMHVLENNPTPDDIAEECENILYEHVILLE